MAIDKLRLNLLGKERVVAQLQQRGVSVALLDAGSRRARVQVTARDGRTGHVEVKSASTRRFITGLYQRYKSASQEHPQFWVLYHFAGDGSETGYVLSHDEVALAQARRNSPDGESLSWAERVALVPDGVDNLLARDIADHEGAWHKIVNWASG